MMKRKTDQSCSLFKVAASLVGYALLSALSTGGRPKGVTQRAD